MPRSIGHSTHLYVWRALALLLGVLGTGAAMWLEPPRCPIALRWHRPCPGCGLTRAGRLLLHGDVTASLALHPLLVPLVGSLVALLVLSLSSLLRRGDPNDLVETRAGRGALYAVGLVTVAMLALWGARELGMFGGPVPV